MAWRNKSAYGQSPALIANRQWCIDMLRGHLRHSSFPKDVSIISIRIWLALSLSRTINNTFLLLLIVSLGGLKLFLCLMHPPNHAHKLWSTNGLEELNFLVKIPSEPGSQFTSSLWSVVTQQLGVKHICTSAYHQQANSLIERFDRHWSLHYKPDWWGQIGLENGFFLALEQYQMKDFATSAELVYGSPITVPGMSHFTSWWTFPRHTPCSPWEGGKFLASADITARCIFIVIAAYFTTLLICIYPAW